MGYQAEPEKTYTFTYDQEPPKRASPLRSGASPTAKKKASAHYLKGNLANKVGGGSKSPEQRGVVTRSNKSGERKTQISPFRKQPSTISQGDSAIDPSRASFNKPVVIEPDLP